MDISSLTMSEDEVSYILFISQILDSLVTHMEMVTEIILPTIFTLCILISIVLLLFFLQNHS